MYYRLISRNEIKKLNNIKRRESIKNTYYILNGKLFLKNNPYIRNWQKINGINNFQSATSWSKKIIYIK